MQGKLHFLFKNAFLGLSGLLTSVTSAPDYARTHGIPNQASRLFEATKQSSGKASILALLISGSYNPRAKATDGKNEIIINEKTALKGRFQLVCKAENPGGPILVLDLTDVIVHAFSTLPLQVLEWRAPDE